MFFHIFKYKAKFMLRDKQGVFWGLFFPIIMATLFFITFSNLMSGETFEKIDVAIVNETSNLHLVQALEETDLLQIIKADIDTSKKLLDEGKISGIIDAKDDITLTVLKNGINQSILKNIIDTYKQVTATINGVIECNPEIVNTNFLNELNVRQQFTKEKPIGSSTNIIVVFFYALIGMSSIMGGTQAITDIEMIQADQSATAARVNVAPTHKLKAFISTLSCTVLFHFISILISILFMVFVLKIDFGNQIPYILLLVLIGCFTGIMLGAMISSLIKKTGIKIAIIISTTMFGAFLSGMMSVEIKYWVQENIPILSYINPINLVTDGLYSLYYYGVNERYFINLALLIIFAFIGCGITYLKVRRQKYASL